MSWTEVRFSQSRQKALGRRRLEGERAVLVPDHAVLVAARESRAGEEDERKKFHLSVRLSSQDPA